MILNLILNLTPDLFADPNPETIADLSTDPIVDIIVYHNCSQSGLN
jgi:hypothetical protein